MKIERYAIVVADPTEGIEKPLELYLGGAFDLRIVKDAPSLRTACENKVPALLIQDIMLPGANGLELAAALLSAHNELMLGIISSAGSRDNVLRARQLGARFFLLKPYSMKDMARQVNSLFNTESIASGRSRNNQLVYRIMYVKTEPAHILCELKGELSLYNSDELDSILRTIAKARSMPLYLDLSGIVELDTKAFEMLNGLGKALNAARIGMKVMAIGRCIDRFTYSRIVAQLPLGFNPEPPPPVCQDDL